VVGDELQWVLQDEGGTGSDEGPMVEDDDGWMWKLTMRGLKWRWEPRVSSWGGARHRGWAAAVGRQRPGSDTHGWRQTGERRGMTDGPPLQSWAVLDQNGLNHFKISNGLETFRKFQTLIDPNLTFLSSKNLK
jgi:hypothetical protein